MKAIRFILSGHSWKIKVKLTNKKVKSRPNSINWIKIKLARALYAVAVENIITHNTLLINIDKTSFNRHTKINYSWRIKRYPVEVKNSSF